MYIHRTIEKTIGEISRHFKVLLLTGARQVGKSTVLRYCDPQREYVTLDDMVERDQALNDPLLFLERHRPPVIIDEIQYAPNLLSYIKMAVDSSESMGGYWLTGSQQFQLMQGVSESLAGRVGIVQLYGLSLVEIGGQPQQVPFFPQDDYEEKRCHAPHYTSGDIFQKIWRGCLPQAVVDEGVSRDFLYGSYLSTYIERDVRNLTKVDDLMKFYTFIRAVACRTGQVLRYSELARDAGISEPTAKSWMSILVASNIVYLLEPYYANFGKRLTRMPKIYFLDLGLCAYLLRMQSPEMIRNGNMAGAFFESFVVGELIKSYAHNGLRPYFSWYRDVRQQEIDLIIEAGGMLYPIEIKVTAGPNAKMVKNFELIGEKRGRGTLICLRDRDLALARDIDAIPVSYI